VRRKEKKGGGKERIFESDLKCDPRRHDASISGGKGGESKAVLRKENQFLMGGTTSKSLFSFIRRASVSAHSESNNKRRKSWKQPSLILSRIIRGLVGKKKRKQVRIQGVRMEKGTITPCPDSTSSSQMRDRKRKKKKGKPSIWELGTTEKKGGKSTCDGDSLLGASLCEGRSERGEKGKRRTVAIA